MVFLIGFIYLFMGTTEVPVQAYQDNLSQTNSTESVSICGGGIVMEADMMRVSTNAPNVITEVKIYNQAAQDLVWETQGCSNAECYYNLETLASGTYYVVVTTETGEPFNGFITLL